eukprot:gene25691-11356_t
MAAVVEVRFRVDNEPPVVESISFPSCAAQQMWDNPYVSIPLTQTLWPLFLAGGPAVGGGDGGSERAQHRHKAQTVSISLMKDNPRNNPSEPPSELQTTADGPVVYPPQQGQWGQMEGNYTLVVTVEDYAGLDRLVLLKSYSIEGNHTLVVTVEDFAGLVLLKSYSIVVDNTAPVSRVANPPQEPGTAFGSTVQQCVSVGSPMSRVANLLHELGSAFGSTVQKCVSVGPPMSRVANPLQEPGTAFGSTVTLDFGSTDLPKRASSGTAYTHFKLERSQLLAPRRRGLLSSLLPQNDNMQHDQQRRQLISGAPQLQGGQVIVLGEWTNGTSPVTMENLVTGMYSFQARGVDLSGNVGEPSEAYTFWVDTDPSGSVGKSSNNSTRNLIIIIVQDVGSTGTSTNILLLGFGVGVLLLGGLWMFLYLRRKKSDAAQDLRSGADLKPVPNGVPGGGAGQQNARGAAFLSSPRSNQVVPTGQAESKSSQLRLEEEDEHVRQAIHSSIEEQNLRLALEKSIKTLAGTMTIEDVARHYDNVRPYQVV